MRRASLGAVLTLSLLTGSARAGEPGREPQQTDKKPPRIEVVFVLDTTGSMGGMIEGAKRKIWAIATDLLAGKPKPEVLIGLVAYRDHGDAYVTKTTALTDDLDKVYKELSQLQADGGGDTPEDVRAGLNEALTKIQWTKDGNALRTVFLVGDAPAHTDYADEPTVEELCKTAVTSGIAINTIRCGGDPETEAMWKDIAHRTEGRYFSIAQEGGVVSVATPFDKELGELNDRLAKTAVAYGAKEKREEAGRREAASAAMAPDAKADRACAKGYAGRYSSDDLVDAVAGGKDLATIPVETLPDELQKMSPEERKAFIEKKAKEREELRAKVIDLARKRDAFIASEEAKRGGGSGLDKVAVEALAEQAHKKGFEINAK